MSDNIEMTITNKEFIKLREWVVLKSGLETKISDKGNLMVIVDTYFTRVDMIELDYNILMKAVENINDVLSNNKYKISMDSTAFYLINRKDDKIEKVFYRGTYGSMLLALQHALLYIMENER